MPVTSWTDSPGPVDNGRRGGGWFANWPLRSKLVAITLTLLAVICLAIGVSAHGAMDRFLSAKLDEQLQRASDSAVRSQRQFRVFEDAPLVEEGHGPPTLNARIAEDGIDRAGVFNSNGRVTDLTSADFSVLSSLVADGRPENHILSVGNYRLVANIQEDNDVVIVSGLPLVDNESTLGSLTATMTVATLGGLAAAAVLGVVVIRRTLRPLEELSSVATRVSRLPLSAGEVSMAERVPDDVAGPGTEVGRLGRAFNLMLDNVDGALRARHGSELALRQFIADASHELRTPLTSIRGYAEMVRLAEDLSPDGRASISRVEAETARMTALVEDLLFLARIEEGIPSGVADVDLAELAVESVNDIRVGAPDHRWLLSVPEEPLVVRADAGHLRQVLINLLSNAHKHTGPATTVTTSVAEEPGGDILVTVEDDGPGIPEEFIDLAFSRFARADSSRSDRSGTHGLGLAIAKGIVEAHGGRITVDSAPGRTVFAVRLPRGIAVPARERVAGASD